MFHFLSPLSLVHTVSSPPEFLSARRPAGCAFYLGDRSSHIDRRSGILSIVSAIFAGTFTLEYVRVRAIFFKILNYDSINAIV